MTKKLHISLIKIVAFIFFPYPNNPLVAKYLRQEAALKVFILNSWILTKYFIAYQITNMSELSEEDGSSPSKLITTNNDIEAGAYRINTDHEIQQGVNSGPCPSHDQIGVVRETTFIILVCLTQFLTQTSLSQTIITGDTLAEAFNVLQYPGEKAWFTAAFALTVGPFILLAARLGDLYGYKTIYVLSYIVISIGSLLAGVSCYSKSRAFFDVSRSLQGLGIAFATPNSTNMVGIYYPNNQKKTMIMVLYGALAPAGFVIGSLFNTLLTTRSWWPWMFYLTAIVSSVASILGYLIIPKNIGVPTCISGTYI